MSDPTETQAQLKPGPTRGARHRQAGVVLVFSAGEAMAAPIPLGELGRGTIGGVVIADSTMSRKHASVAHDGKRWTVRDLGSRNGVMVDGERIPAGGELELDRPRLMRLGESIFLFSLDREAFAEASLSGDRVAGPSLRRAWDAIASAARSGGTLHITGESGSGKELAARAFHDAGAHAAGPFIAVNCAAIPEGVAERLLFGARKGAFSGAHENAEGYVQAADGGTLFLDEVGELDLQVQAKLLRVLETREVLALGDNKPRRVDIRVCSATHRELRGQVAEKRFREDLFFRLGLPHVVLPPLRERLEEIPWFIERELRKLDPSLIAAAAFVEACMLRTWPGNVRELLAEVREAGRTALADGAGVVDVDRLSPAAGASFERAQSPSGTSITSQGGMPAREVIEETLRREDGRIATAARVLGIHRNQLRRWLAKHNVDARAFADKAGDSTEDSEPDPSEP